MDAPDVIGRTPLKSAVLFKSAKSAAALLAHGANPLVVDREGDTPLAYAERMAKERSLYKRAERREILRLMEARLGELETWPSGSVAWSGELETFGR